MNNKTHIFISYRSLERGFVTKLFRDLQRSGIPVWMDRDKAEGITVGDRWTHALDQALKKSNGMIVVLTPEYFESDYCKDELDFAYRNRLALFPVLLRKPQEEHMPGWLPSVQSLDFTMQANEIKYLQGLEELVKAIKKKNLYELVISSAQDHSLEDLFKTLELGRDNPGKLVNAFVERLWGNAKHEKGWIELDRVQNILGQLAWEILRQFESSTGKIGLAYAIEWSTYHLTSQSIIRFGKEKAAKQFIQLLSRLRLIQTGDGELSVGEGRRIQAAFQFAHPALLAYFAAIALRKLSLEEMMFRSRYNELWRRINHHWDDAFIALCGIVDDAGSFIIRVAAFDPILASKCLHSGIEITPSVQLCVRKQLEKQLPDTLGDPNYLLDTVTWLVRTKGVSAVPDLLFAYQACPSAWQEKILELIVDFGRDAVPALLNGLRTPDHLVCSVRALGEIGDLRALGPLQDLANSIDKNNQYFQTIIAASLAKLQDKPALERLRQAA